MTQAHLKTDWMKNVQVVPVEPNVKSAKTFKLSLCGVTDFPKIGKTTDPTCYASIVKPTWRLQWKVSTFTSRMSVRASERAGDWCSPRLDGSGCVSMIGTDAHKGSNAAYGITSLRQIASPSTGARPCPIHPGSGGASVSLSLTCGTLTNYRRARGRRLPRLHLTGRLAQC